MIEIFIDGEKANLRKNMLYKGAGMVSANNSSRLLLDYKAEHPDDYNKILEYIFSDKGIGVNHLKLEMGSDINSSSGTEPATMRFADEIADTTRGAGYQLAADAKKINPELTLDMLWWSEPLWISNAEDVYAARYSWYKNTLDSAFVTYGIKFDYVSAVQNERDADPEWVKYLSTHLKNEKNCPYDYSKIKIVGGEEVTTWNFVSLMNDDEELMKAVDVVGSHYTSFATPEAKELALSGEKELWFSEACSPMGYAEGNYRFEETGNGFAGINGLLDIANRIVAMYPNGGMTLYEYQPVVAAYYDGVTYCQKQLINACNPWSGFYHLDSGFYLALHFSQFIKKGWAFVDDACFSDGRVGGDGHAIIDAKLGYMTATNCATGDYSTVIVNSTAEQVDYKFNLKNIKKASEKVYVWETRGPEGDNSDEHFFREIKTITPIIENDQFIYSVAVKPYSVITVSTLNIEREEFINEPEEERSLLELPYSDDFSYKEYPENYLSSRGNAPRYTTDQGGAFEVEVKADGNRLVQKITKDLKAKEWGYTPEPVTCLGDDRWFNLAVSVTAFFEKSETAEQNYVGIGMRYTLACNGCSGYSLRLFENGSWKLLKNDITLLEGRIDCFDSLKAHKLRIEASGAEILGFVDYVQVANYRATSEALVGGGRVALYSSFNRNEFSELLVEPLDKTYIRRFDNSNKCFSYSGDWLHNTMSSFRSYKRTLSTGKAGAELSLKFSGVGFLLLGECDEGALLKVNIDGKDEIIKTNKCGSREAICFFDNLSNGEHIVKVEVATGEISVDALEVFE